MQCKECEIELRTDNKSGYCQKHAIKNNSHLYYLNLRKEHKCLRCKADIIPLMKNGQLIYRRLCEIHRQAEKLRRKERKSEEINKAREYRINYQKSEKYKNWLKRPEIIERRKAYMAKFRKKHEKISGININALAEKSSDARAITASI